MARIENGEDAIEETVGIIIEESRELVKDVIEHTENYAEETSLRFQDVDVWVGTQDYYEAMQECAGAQDVYEKVGYHVYVRALVEDYLRHVTPSGTNVRGHSNVYKGLNQILGELARRDINWLEWDGHNRGLELSGKVWVSYFPEEIMLEMQNRIEKCLKRGASWNRNVKEEVREALIEFPRKFNEHTVGEIYGYRQFYADLNHELTHKFLRKTTSINNHANEHGDALNEGAAWFVSNYLKTELSDSKGSGLDFKHSPEKYSEYKDHGIDPQRIYWVVELLRESIKHELMMGDQVSGYPVDVARQTVAAYMMENNRRNHLNNSYLGWRGFLLYIVPEDLEDMIKSIRKINREELNTAVNRLKHEIDHVENEGIKDTFAEKLEADFQELKSPHQIEEDIMKKIPEKVAEDEGGFDELISLIEQDVGEQASNLLQVKEDLQDIHFRGKPQLMDEIRNTQGMIEKVEAHLESVLVELDDYSIE